MGLHGKKFRFINSDPLYLNAETNGPMLSSKEDTRITSWGRIMRKWRLDSCPQFN